MVRRARIQYTENQKAAVWDRDRGYDNADRGQHTQPQFLSFFRQRVQRTPVYAGLQ